VRGELLRDTKTKEDRGEPMATKNPLPETRVLKEGFLTKKGSALVKQWKERWFVVKGQNLYYFRNPRVSSKSLA